MRLPETLQLAIEAEVNKFSFAAIVKATEDLSIRYREKREKLKSLRESFMESDIHRAAYLLSRLPATFAANQAVFLELEKRMFDCSFESLLDLGSGPGTATWAANERFLSIKQFTLMEQDGDLIALGKKLMSFSEDNSLLEARWNRGDLVSIETFPSHDLIVISYALGELPVDSYSSLISKVWQSAKKAVVIIEPGTMAGFATIKAIRSMLISSGANLVAPCPHALACPMPSNDWCHFSERVERSSLHRTAKGGTLGYEDEKYSYVIASKTAVSLPNARILRHPLKRSGHVCLELCTAHESLKKETISRRDDDLYKLARKFEWGSSY